MTVKELIVKLMDYEKDQVVEFVGYDLGWSNIEVVGDRFNPKIVPAIQDKHASREWLDYISREREANDS